MSINITNMLLKKNEIIKKFFLQLTLCYIGIGISTVWYVCHRNACRPISRYPGRRKYNGTYAE